MPKKQIKDKTLLEVSHLNKTFRNGKNIVVANNDVSFKIPYGKVVGLIGESGSGKTTVGRTIMNLHAPDSGSIKLDGQEIGGAKLSKVQKKFLYDNVQMIFQDPYSSLNAQKNIMTIVAESLKAKKIDKEIYNGYIYNRGEILSYFENELKEKFFHEYWAYRKFANGTALEGLQDVNKELDHFVIDEKKNMFQNFTRFSNKVYDIKSVANYKIISKLDELIESTISEWKIKQEAIEKDSFSFKDEKDLQDARKELAKAKYNLEASESTHKLQDKKKELEKELSDNISIHKANLKNTLINYKNIIKNIKLKKSGLINKKMESLSIDAYNHYEGSIERCNTKIFVIRQFKNKKIEVSTTEVFNKIDAEFKKRDESIKSTAKYISSKIIEDSNQEKHNISDLKIKNIETLAYKKASGEVRSKIKEFSLALIKSYENQDKTMIIHSKNIKMIESSIKEISAQIKESKEKDSNRDTKKLKEIVDLKTKRVKKYKDIFDDELSKFKKESIKKLETQKVEMNKLVDIKWKQILSLRKQVDIKEKEIIKSIILLKTFDKSESGTLKIATKRIKSEYKKAVDLNKRLDLEIKVNMIALDKIKYLYNIKSRLSLFKNKKLKNVFIRQEVFETLQKVGLNKAAAYRYPHEFSGGMRQRVGIARALISKPKLIIADEPIAALDLSIQAQIVNLLLELKEKENISLLFIAHDLSMIEYNSDDVVIMHLGRIVEYGNAKDIFKNPIHPYTRNLMSSIPKLSDIKEKFKDQKFYPEYLDEYKNFNDPIYFEVRKGHFVLASKDQIDAWKK